MLNFFKTSCLWFFLSVWGGSKKVIKTCKVLMRNFLQGGGEFNIRAKVPWEDVCAPS